MNHHRIGMLYGVAIPDLAMDRLQPYKESLISTGLPVEEELIIQCGSTIEDGYLAAQNYWLFPRALAQSLRSMICWPLETCECPRGYIAAWF